MCQSSEFFHLLPDVGVGQELLISKFTLKSFFTELEAELDEIFKIEHEITDNL